MIFGANPREFCYNFFMRQNHKEFRQFWEGRYRKHKYEWGKKPSILVSRSMESFPKEGTVLDVACGYGRDAIFMAGLGYQVHGMDFSELAIERARSWAERENLQIDFREGKLVNCGYSNDFFDGVTMFNTLHLLWEAERVEIVSEIHRILKRSGMGIFALFSTKEKGFGKGEEVEKNSFLIGNGRIRHYFTTEDIQQTFSTFSSVSAKELYISPEEHEHQGREKHGHHEWLVTVAK